MTYVLHGARGSGSCAVECVLAEIGADYELRELSLRGDEQQGEEYAAVNPHRKVPSLVIDDGPPLTESVAILLTLDDRHPETALLPAKGTPARAQALRWLLFAATEIYPIVEINDYPERFATDPDQIDAMRERAREIWRARWLVVEANVDGDPYAQRFKAHIVNYADDLVVLGKAPSAEMLTAFESLMQRLKLTVNAEKTRCC